MSTEQGHLERYLAAGLSLPREHVGPLARLARRRTYRPREAVFHAGDQVDGFHVVIGGEISLELVHATGLVVSADIVGAGGIVGLQDVMAMPEKRTVDARAGAPTVTFFVASCVVNDLRRDALVWSRVSDVAARSTSHYIERIRELTHPRADARVAMALLKLSAGTGVIRTRQGSIAALAGVTRQTVCLIVSALHRRGVVRRDGPCLHVVDRSALGEMAR